MVQLAHQKSLSVLHPPACFQRLIAFGDGPAEFEVGHYLPREHCEREDLILVQVTWHMVEDA